MTQENVEIVRKLWGAFVRGDIDETVGLFDADAEIVGQRAAFEGAYVGQAGVRRWAREALEARSLGRFDWQLDEVRECGDRVVVLGSQWIRGAVSGATVDAPVAVVVEFREGRIAHWQAYASRPEALEAVGLAE